MPRIIFDTDKTIDFNIGPNSLLQTTMDTRSLEYAGSGVLESIYQYSIDLFSIDMRFSAAVERQMYNFWWYWVRKGRFFSLAMDTSKIGETTLDAAAAAGQAVVPVTATTDFSADDEIMIISATTFAREKKVIDSISAGVSLTVDENLYNTFASGDTVRHASYHPSLLCTDTEYAPDRTGKVYTLTLNTVEVYSDGYLDTDEGVFEL